MKKRIVTLLLTLALVFSMACPAFACSSYSEKSYKSAVELVDSCNKLVDAMVNLAKLTPYNDVPALVVSVDALVFATESAVNALGFEVECEYTLYVIDGQKVWIDPLRVVPPLDD